MSLPAGNPLTPPTATSVTPPTGTPGVCPNNALITATFSKAMNPATINITTFTVTSGGASVTGTVTYNATNNVATFTPIAALALNTTYTAKISTGAADTFGNTLAANVVWTFTTATVACTAPSSVALGTACGFGILGATPVVSNTGLTIVTGDVGVWPAASITVVPTWDDNGRVRRGRRGCHVGPERFDHGVQQRRRRSGWGRPHRGYRGANPTGWRL